MKRTTLAAVLILALVPASFADESAPPPVSDTDLPAVSIDIDGDAATAAVRARVKSGIADIVKDVADGEAGTYDRVKLEAIGEAIDKLDNLDGGDEKNGGIGANEAVVAMFAIMFTFGMPIMIVAAVLYTSYRKRRLVHETINAYVAAGKEIPPEVFASFQGDVRAPRSNLHRGLVMVGLGAGIAVCFLAIGASGVAAVGAIPLFIGLAQLLIWKLERNGHNGRHGGQ